MREEKQDEIDIDGMAMKIRQLEKDKQALVQHGIEQGIQISNLEHGKKEFIEWLESRFIHPDAVCLVCDVLNKAKEVL